MQCKDCSYKTKTGKYHVCRITNSLLFLPLGQYTKECSADSEEEIENAAICFNCKHWLGGGDWGLSCKKHYHNCSTNGFSEACGEFERKSKEALQ